VLQNGNGSSKPRQLNMLEMSSSEWRTCWHKPKAIFERLKHGGTSASGFRPRVEISPGDNWGMYLLIRRLEVRFRGQPAFVWIAE
jgi:hypothetical protein